MGKVANQGFGDAVDEIVAIGVSACVGEREHGDGIAVKASGGCVGPLYRVYCLEERSSTIDIDARENRHRQCCRSNPGQEPDPATEIAERATLAGRVPLHFRGDHRWGRGLIGTGCFCPGLIWLLLVCLLLDYLTPVQPLFQLVCKSVDDPSALTGKSVDWHTAVKLPTPHGALVALEKGGDLLPGVQALRRFGLGQQRSPCFRHMSLNACF